jgi:2',3'-cyclic-nucleotide 2'-phosphodiesterase (5'-nucleotidase family)
MMAGRVAAVDAVSINDVSIAEGNSGAVDVSFTVARSLNEADFTVKWVTANGTAVQPGDYTAGSGTLTFAAGGALSQTVTVSIKGDVLAEADETVFVDLTDLVVTGGAASMLDARGAATILNDDANRPPTVATPISERNAPVTAAFSYAFPANTFADADGHPLTYGATLNDGSALPAWLSFNAGTRTFSGTPAVANIGRYTVRLTATDNWVPPGSVSTDFVIAVGYPVSVANTSVTEGDSGTASLVFTVSRTVTDTAFAVNYAFSGTAVSGTDYVAIPGGTLNFAAGGALSQTVTVTVNGDTVIEAGETVILTLSGIVNTTGSTVLGTAAGTGTIVNDDFVPSRFPASGVLGGTVKGFIDLDAAPLTGGAEIPAFDPASKRAFTSSGTGIQVIDLTNPAAPAFVTVITPATLGVVGLTSNDVSSVAVRKGTGGNPSVLAAGVISVPKTDAGYVVFLDAATGALLGSAQTGPNPDHIAFTPDGSKLLVANEGETAGNVADDTTKGGVTIVDVAGGFASPLVTTADFTAFDAQAATLVANGVRLFPGGVPSTDLEPEYFAISADGKKALVTLQEANSVAVLDIDTATFTSIKALGKKNFATGEYDFSDRDGAGAVALVNPRAGQPVYGLYMPDAVAAYSSGGATYYVTANEGDDRNDFIVPMETTTVANAAYDLDNTVFPNETALKNQASLGRLTVSNVPGIRGDTDGDGDIDEILSYGGRSFSILNSAGDIVFDSGDMLENIMASQFLANFDDGRSDNKGPEPEGVTVATIGAQTYAFVGLERSHMVLVFDVTDPAAVSFTGGLRRTGDLNPEGMAFVAPGDSPTGKALLLVASESSQTLTVHELTVNVTLNAAATAGLSVGADTSPLALAQVTGASPAGGVFAGAGVEGGVFDPALAVEGANVLTYTVGTEQVSFTVTVTAAPVLAAAPSNALTAVLAGSVVVSDNGTATGVGGAEIPAFDPASKRAFSASNAGIQVIDLTNPAVPVRLAPIDPTVLGLTTKDVSHVVVKNGVLAASLIASPDKTLPGTVAFFEPATGVLLGSVAVGAVPDQLIFTPDGTKVLVANEGEMTAPVVAPAPAPADPDPVGSVSIIDVSGGFASPTVMTAGFEAFDGQESALRAAGVRVFPGRAASRDLEPEYIAVSPDGTRAMVTLQEANAIATLDIATATITGVKPLGLKNYARVTGDFSDRDGSGNGRAIELKTGLPAFGMFMPDSIAAYQTGGATYYVTANEGDDRNDFMVPEETTTVNATAYDLDNTVFPTEGTPGGSGSAGAGTGLKGNDQLGRLTVSNVPGLRGDLDGDGDIDRILSYGSRSFSILDAEGRRVFDSGDVLDRIVAQYYPSLWDDSRSDNKSIEPEGVSVATLGGRSYAFIGLERAHAVFVFDVTDPAAVSFVTSVSRRGDLNPEGMLVVPAADSPNGQPLLLVASEVSLTLSVFSLLPAAPAMQLQILHYYGESGLLGIQTAPIMGAMIDRFDNEYPTVVLGEGDSFIPGPWLTAGADASLNAVPGIGTTALARPDIAIMNAFGTTASALGNHEFDLGSPVLQTAIAPSGSGASAWVGAQFPLITANLDFASDSSLRSLADVTLGGPAANNFRGDEVTNQRARIAPYAVKTVAGQKIGFVGATTWELLVKSSPNGTRPMDDGNVATSDLQEVAAYVQTAVDALRAIGVNKIIMLDQLDTLQRNKDLAPLLTGVDVMVAGGGHERMGDANDVAVGFNGHDADFIADSYPIMSQGLDGKPTLIVTTDTEYSYLGRLVVDFDANGELLTDSLNPVVNGAYAAAPAVLESVVGNGQTASQIVAASPVATRVKAIVDALNAVVVSKDSAVFGFTKVYLEGDRVFGRAQEVNLGNITADANAQAARVALGLPTTAPVVSLKNGGGLRASLGAVAPDGTKIPPVANPLTGKPEGGVSLLDIENALRFDNRLMVFDATPKGLVAILEYAAGLSSGNGGFPQVGNIRFSFDRTLTPKVRSVVLVNDVGAIVSEIVRDGVILAGAPASIPMVALNFTANGGDGYPIKYLDPAATPPNQIANPETGNFRYVLTGGGLSAEVPRNLDFAEASVIPAGSLGEQKAFGDYLTMRHGTRTLAYNAADTPVAEDQRIQQLPARSLDTVRFTPVELWRQEYFGNPDGSGNEGNTGDADGDSVNNLFEFAFGTNPSSAVSGTGELSYLGTFAGEGSIGSTGQPITGFEHVPNSVDFRFVFIRRKDYQAAGLIYTPQFSADLETWRSSTAVPEILADDGTHQVVSVPYIRFINGRKAQFARLMVTMP